MKPKFSIIIPAYNVEKYIDEAIRSVLNQNYDNYEIIIVDDCSTDGTLEKIKNYEDARISVYSTEKNSKTAGAPRNIAMNHAKR